MLAIKNQEPEISASCEHSIQFDHLIDWNNSKVLKTEAHYSKRLTSETRFINSHPHVMNQSDGDSPPPVYRRLTLRRSQLLQFLLCTFQLLQLLFLVQILAS